MRLTLVLLPLLLAGCSTFGLSPEQIDALAKDPATVCTSITSVYGKFQFARTNIVNGNVACSQDGLTVKSDASQIGVPITITPQFRIEAPQAMPPIPMPYQPMPIVPRRMP